MGICERSRSWTDRPIQARRELSHRWMRVTKSSYELNSLTWSNGKVRLNIVRLFLSGRRNILNFGVNRQEQRARSFLYFFELGSPFIGLLSPLGPGIGFWINVFLYWKRCFGAPTYPWPAERVYKGFLLRGIDHRIHFWDVGLVMTQAFRRYKEDKALKTGMNASANSINKPKRTSILTQPKRNGWNSRRALAWTPFCLEDKKTETSSR